MSGCGGHAARPAVVAPASAAVCVHRVPGAAGECVQGTPVRAPGRLGGALGPLARQCIDVSVWQGRPDWAQVRRDGVVCVIVQANDGGAKNPLFGVQAAGARAAGLQVGAYVFLEPRAGGYQAEVLNSVAAGRGVTLGAWVDTEVPGSYGQMCAAAARLRGLGWRIVGSYLSPGNSPFGYTCGTLSWPAEWGAGRAYPPSGWTRSQVVLRQWCGSCSIAGVAGQVDRDEDLGLLALAAPVKPKPKPRPVSTGVLRRELARELAFRAELRALRLEHRCAHPPVKPHTHAWEHACVVFTHQGHELLVHHTIGLLEREIRAA